MRDLRAAFGPQALERLFFRDGGRIVPVAVREIERIEADGDYAAVRVRGKTHLVNLPLSDLEQRLDPERFVRVHRSHIVNLDFVETLEPLDNSQLLVRLRGGATITASRAASKRLRDLAV